MAQHLFLISYILDNQPGTCEMRSDDETVSQEHARRASSDRSVIIHRCPGPASGA